MYKVIKLFTDLQDNGYKYNVGDIYPRKGYISTEKRISELAGTANRQKTPLIEEISERIEEETAEKPKKRRRQTIEE